MQTAKREDILAHMRRGAAVVTVNRRLSRSLASEYDDRMKAAGLSAWMSPQVMPLTSWAVSLWEAGFPEKPLLSDRRAFALWEKVIASDEAFERLGILNQGGLAEASFEAYALIREYGVVFPDDIYLTEEARALKGWMRAFKEEIERAGFVDRVSLTERLIRLMEDGKARLPEELVIAGFDEATPLTARLITALKERVKITFWPYSPFERPEPGPCVLSPVTIRPCADATEEVVQAARWIRTLKPDSRVGVIVPELHKYRDIIKREFSAELHPASVLPGGCQEVFNISLGASLYEDPLVKSALDILSIGPSKVDTHKISAVFFSPYLMDREGILEWGRIDARLREENRLKVSLWEIRQALLPPLKDKAGAWIDSFRKAPDRDLPSAWAGFFSNLLKDIGWLKPIRLSSSEYQAMKAFNALIEEFSSLDDIIGKITRQEAASRLSWIAAETMHQPETKEARIEVLGLLEATGLLFDHVWVIGGHQYALPPEPSPNPFIPALIQRQYKLPHSSFEREEEFARRALDRVLSSAPAIEASYPARDNDRELKPSPLLRNTGVVDEKKFSATSRLKDAVHGLYAVEEAEDDFKIPLGDQEAARISGGTSILKDQSLCPFKAFATYRLGASGIAAPEPGIPASKRGSILHVALKLFWEELRDSERLAKMSEAMELEGFINTVAERAIAEAGLSGTTPSRFLEIEKERLKSLIKDWARVELKRGPFKVKRIELESDLDISGLKLKGRIDRIDEDDQGRVMIIDYKSGIVSRDDWTTERPREPQLLIYSVTGSFDAVSFARVAPGECRFVGVASADELLPGIKSFDKDKKIRARFEGVEDWGRLMEYWKTVVEKLARDFKEGIAAVDPVEYGGKSPCKYCGLQVLCRIAERGHYGMEDGDDGEEF